MTETTELTADVEPRAMRFLVEPSYDPNPTYSAETVRR